MGGTTASGPVQAITFILGLIMGTGSTITIKVIYTLTAVGIDGVRRPFDKPLTTTWCMFLGMLCALPAHFAVSLYEKYSKSPASGETQKLVNSAADKSAKKDEIFPLKTCLALAIPSCFDLVGTALAQLGLYYCTVSTYQLVRCSVMIVVALLKTAVLKEPLTNYMWLGTFINTVAMVLVALTSFVGGSVSADGLDPRLGIGFLLLSCCVQGSQYVFEEMMMKEFHAPPLLVVGMEGFWGTLIMPFIVFPLAYWIPGSDRGGCMENIWDSWYIAENNPVILYVLISFIVTVFFYNVFAIYVTHLLNSVWHAILDNFRPVSVWGVDLLLFYYFTNGQFGEAWTVYSWLQFFGMIVLFTGTAIFNGSLRLPFFTYPPDESTATKPMTPTIRTPNQAMSSPFLMRSPMITRGTPNSNSNNKAGRANKLSGRATYGSTADHPATP